MTSRPISRSKQRNTASFRNVPPVKYKNDALRTAYKAVEHESARVMASLQPEELQAETQVWLTGSVLNDAERKILKAADRLSAVIKCIEEDRGGNREFEAAYAQQMAALRRYCSMLEHFSDVDTLIEAVYRLQ